MAIQHSIEKGLPSEDGKTLVVNFVPVSEDTRSSHAWVLKVILDADVKEAVTCEYFKGNGIPATPIDAEYALVHIPVDGLYDITSATVWAESAIVPTDSGVLYWNGEFRVGPNGDIVADPVQAALDAGYPTDTLSILSLYNSWRTRCRANKSYETAKCGSGSHMKDLFFELEYQILGADSNMQEGYRERVRANLQEIIRLTQLVELYELT